MAMTLSADNPQWRYYKYGVLTSASGCPASPLNHQVVLAGYGLFTGTTPNTSCRLATSAETTAKACSSGGKYYLMGNGKSYCCTDTPTTVTDVPVWKV